MFIVLRHIKSKRSNFQQTPYLVSGAPVFASVMLGHAIASRLDKRDLGVGIVHHSASPHIEYLPNTNGWVNGLPCQYRGATGDIASGGSGPIQNSVQPAVTGDLDISLILEIDGAAALSDVREVITKMRIRLAGGGVPQLPYVQSAECLHAAIRACGRGYWLSDATHVVQDRMNSGLPIVEAVMGRVAGGWHVPATLGYRAITRFEQRAGARDGLDHAYSEALVGLVRYDSVHSVGRNGSPSPTLWSHRWVNPSSFVVQQGITS